ncbi:hypothetical protein [Dietzia psychralcaliphila]|uniref:Uncharacterized protein n=1 Tax=Dietzia psychralcaliphila TaxID=139021 RepID=A0AAD0NNF4_9ACTN|nr:hypothetical protein [Dietzia psychralcaliphila]AWH96595.1 hypothetical protein A6048_15105 [Dietzia psychralcaliphila]PTM89189.1 hypothetical protein C8N39_10230 [Dietzia psychralcaliphila]
MTGPRDGSGAGRDAGNGGGGREVDPPTEPNPSADPPTEQMPSADPPTEPNPSADPPTQQIPPADPPTEHLPPVEGEGTGTAWSQYPAGPAMAAPTGSSPTGGYPTGDVPPQAHVPPPGDVPPPVDGGDDGWDGSGRGGSPTPWMIVAILLAVVLVAGLIVWLVNSGRDDRDPVTVPTTTTATTTSTPRTTPRPTTPTTTGPPGVAERCSPEFVAEELGDDTTVRECDGRFLLVSGEDGDLELLSWREDTWEFLAEPSSEVCREQLEQLGVPDQFRRVFQPCEAPTPSPTTPSPTTPATTPASPTPPTAPTTVTTPPAPPADPGAGGVEEGAAAGDDSADDASVDDDDAGDRAEGDAEES